MRQSDVYGFRSRSKAAYGILALDFIAEQLYQRADGELLIDAVTLIEMRDYVSLFCHREPLDWLLFNKLLERQKEASPRSHGNYNNALQLAQAVIDQDLEHFTKFGLDHGDIPAYSLVFLSDGKPSDCTFQHEKTRIELMHSLCKKLKTKLTVYGMGIGAKGEEFQALKNLIFTAKLLGAEGDFVHAGISSAAIGDAFASFATSTTATRTELLSKNDSSSQRPSKQVSMRDNFANEWPSKRFVTNVERYHYDPELASYPWEKGDFQNKGASGFEIEDNPFGKGAERLAYRFYEISWQQEQRQWKRVGGLMVAKESNKIQTSDETQKEKFHETFCKVQLKAYKLAGEFNKTVKKTPALRPIEDEVCLPPPIHFLNCYVYEYEKNYIKCGYLVENYLKGKFTKYSNNMGYVKTRIIEISLQIGKVYMTDFLHAFSHWIYYTSAQSMIVCDLQGVLDLEGRNPVFKLTDPAIVTRRKTYGKTDMGMNGIRAFCRTHKCNDVCKGLGLPPIR